MVSDGPIGGFRMASEFCREAAVLIFVFGNLDVWTKAFTGELFKDGLSPWLIARHVTYVFVISAVFMIAGVLLEKWRDQ